MDKCKKCGNQKFIIKTNTMHDADLHKGYWKLKCDEIISVNCVICGGSYKISKFLIA